MLLGRTTAPVGAAALRPDQYGFLWIEKSMFADNFSQDCPAEESLVMALAQKPTSGRCFEDKPDYVGWKNLPTWYQVSEQDRMIPPATQHFFAERMKAEMISLPSSHASMASHPQEIADLILKAAEKLEA
ncbi:Alpha/beta hydrolase family protein [compost metagenome]